MGYCQNEDRLNAFLEEYIPGLPIPHSKAAEKVTQSFLLARWQERAKECGGPQPTSLSGACKFTSLFTIKVFGGEMRGNYDHQWVELHGEVIDPTNNVDGGAIEHDDDFWLNEEHLDALVSCLPRVRNWLKQFNTP